MAPSPSPPPPTEQNDVQRQPHHPPNPLLFQLPKPGDILYKVAAKAPLLIGWDDDKFRELLEEHRRKEFDKLQLQKRSANNTSNKSTITQEQNQQQQQNLDLNDDITKAEYEQFKLSIEKHGFGLQGILSDAVKEYVYKQNTFDDLKSDLKKIEDSGATMITGSDLLFNTQSLSGTNGEHKSSSNRDATGIGGGSTTRTDSGKNNSGSTEFNIREMKLYQNLLSNVKYQRDAYIMGVDHANRRKKHRDNLAQTEKEAEKEKSNKNNSNNTTISSSSLSSKHEPSRAFPFGVVNISKNTTLRPFTTYQQYLDLNPLIPSPPSQTSSPSAASTQLIQLATWFIPSPVMHESLLPTVLWTIAPPMTQPHNLPDGGPLRKQVVQSSAALIPLSQSLLDATMKNSIIWVLQNSSWRESMKGTTRSLVGNMKRDENGGSSGNGGAAGNGKFVTTKTVSCD